MSPKQILQRLPIAPTQGAKEVITQEFYQMKSGKLFILCINQKRLLKKYIIT